MPEEGKSAQLNLPLPIPLPIMLLRDKTHWVISTDLVLVSSWSSGAPGGFADTPMAKTLYAKAPASACLLGASDTPAVIRTIHGFAGMALAANEKLTPEQKQSINGALMNLAAKASTGFIYASTDAKSSVTEVRGLLGSGILPVLVGAVVIPSIIKSHEAEMGMGDEVTTSVSPEAMAMDALAAQFYTSQMQFRDEVKCDQDGDKTGEYATLAELTGTAPAPGQTEPSVYVNLTGQAANGYRYEVFLPGPNGTVVQADSEPRKVDPAAADAQEHGFVIYAWPEDAAAGTRMFAIDQSGMIFEQTFAGEAPAWNALYGGQGWDGVPTWQAAQR
jgi:hypothetical protein